MSANTTIEWATKSWNPVRGCSRVSPGCDECYAMKFAHRFSGAGKPYEGLTTIRKGKVDWSGVARFIPSELDAPLRWRKPERIFVNSMSDLFHNSLRFEEIAAVFGVMAACERHTFLVLTKRPERAREFFSWVHNEGDDNGGPGIATACGIHAANCGADVDYMGIRDRWPLPNVQLGVSVEGQPRAHRIAEILECPAAVHWVSAEPLISWLDLRRVPVADELDLNALTGDQCATVQHRAIRPVPSDRRIGWVVVGGESGPGARPMNLAWMRSLVEQCEAAKVPVFCKQFGRFVVDSEWKAGVFAEHDKRSIAAGAALGTHTAPNLVLLKHRKGSDLTEIPGDWPREIAQ